MSAATDAGAVPKAGTDAGRAILVLAGSHRGAATRTGAMIAARLSDAGLAARALPMDAATPDAVAAAPALVFCTSTFGSGGVPPRAEALLSAIATGALPLAGRPVAVIGLGDSSFRDTYNGGSRRFAAALEAAGAEIIAPLLLFDASTPHRPPDVAGWMAEVQAAFAARIGR